MVLRIEVLSFHGVNKMEYLVLALFAFAAGFIDAVAGGGGLILLPGLMLVFPTAPYAVLAGTNKITSICGTTFAAFRYLKAFSIDRRVLIGCVPIALVASWCGAYVVSYLEPSLVKPIVIGALILVGLYTAFKPELGGAKSLNLTSRRVLGYSMLIGVMIGFYDGFIGPGTGSFLIFAFVSILGLDFLHASATAKVVNIATNGAAVLYFVSTGQFMIEYAAVMAVANVAGAKVGAHMALSRGNRWIRQVFLVSISLLLLRLIWEQVANW